MKHKTHFLFYLFRPDLSGLIIIAFLLCSVIITAQESTPPQEFPIGAFFNAQTRTNQAYYDIFDEIGMNLIMQRADGSTEPFLDNYNVFADNADTTTDYIIHYSTAWYSKWEAEEDQQEWNRVGVKHEYGDTATFQGRKCWSTEGLSAPACSLVYGPHYHQEKLYKRWYYSEEDRYDKLKYIPRFNMALDVIDTTLGLNEDICRLFVIVRHVPVINGVYHEKKDDTLKVPIILKAEDFLPYGEFKPFYFAALETAWYQYPEEFRDRPSSDKRELPPPSSSETYAIDIYGDQGIQFCVDWLRNDTKCNLYIDNIEVYDNDGWNEYLNPFTQDEVIQKIRGYAQNYSDWSNLKYWLGHDEPSSLDAYTPIKTVDDIIQSAFEGAPPMINNFYPYWEIKVNEDTQLVRYYNTVQPEKLMIDLFPCVPEYNPVRVDDWDLLSEVFQICSSLQPGFHFQAQAHGYWQVDHWLTWRRPSAEELRAQVMLALAHGVKALTFFSFDSYDAGDYILQGIIDTGINHTDLSEDLRDNIVPRLKGKLGNTLMKLDYTGDYIHIECSSCPIHDDPLIDYLTIDCNVSSYFWHCGFFKHKNFPDNKHFLLTNLRTTIPVPTNLIVSNNTGYNNVAFKDIEGGVGRVDTTIGLNSSITYNETMPAGEGRLYRVSPVVLYGGRLIYAEYAGEGQVLMDDMIIENGATLTIYDEYTANANIIVKNGSIVNGENGKIHFAADKKLIIDGYCALSGTAGSKLTLEFTESQNDEIIGITIKSGGALTIANCKVENATIGIQSLLNANYLNAQNVEFINCKDYSINIAGRSPGMNPTPPPQIKNCTMLNSDWGIAITNLPGMLIQNNIITNTAYGIYLSNVTDAQIIGNLLQSNREEMAGIYFQSSGGAIRANYITGHTVGIHLANSSPILGSNMITANKYHGLYVGSGSLPYMRMGQFIGRPPNMYATSGYNKIMANGGYEEEGGPEDNDGSEIYFVNSNAVMSKGCNTILDDREPSPPLINTLLLMNCPAEGHPIYMDARGNYWGRRVSLERFGNLRVDYIPYSEIPCPEPQASADEFVRMTSFGEVIDTVYSVDVEVPELTETEEDYAEAEEYFLTGDLTNALQIYESIINSNSPEEEKYFAYERKYSIGKLAGQTNEFFNEMSNSFLTLATNTQDTLNAKILNQLSTLSKVGEQEYETAINEFDGIIQQNPNTEEAVYAEIDALTTALLIEEADSILQKGRLGKYLIKTSEDYNQRIDEILRRNFGGKSKETEEELLPTEYTLYQNYPNPFNPVTTIKYDLPFVSEVSLLIYDILGRKVKELVNTRQQAGRYEVQFNASNLASGVYVYQLIAEKYISSKKMILLK